MLSISACSNALNVAVQNLHAFCGSDLGVSQGHTTLEQAAQALNHLVAGFSPVAAQHPYMCLALGGASFAAIGVEEALRRGPRVLAGLKTLGHNLQIRILPALPSMLFASTGNGATLGWGDLALMAAPAENAPGGKNLTTTFSDPFGQSLNDLIATNPDQVSTYVKTHLSDATTSDLRKGLQTLSQGIEDKALAYSPFLLTAVHLITTRLVQIANTLTENDPFTKTQDQGHFYNHLAHTVWYAHAYEKHKSPESITPDEKEKLADLYYSFGTRGATDNNSFKTAMLITLNAIQRYEQLGLTEKAREAKTFLEQLKQRTRMTTEDPIKIFCSNQDCSIQEIAELIIDSENSLASPVNAGSIIARSCHEGGYPMAKALYTALADELEKLDGGKPYVPFYRNHAQEAHQRGKALGLM